MISHLIKLVNPCISVLINVIGLNNQDYRNAKSIILPTTEGIAGKGDDVRTPGRLTRKQHCLLFFLFRLTDFLSHLLYSSANGAI